MGQGFGRRFIGQNEHEPERQRSVLGFQRHESAFNVLQGRLQLLHLSGSETPSPSTVPMRWLAPRILPPTRLAAATIHPQLYWQSPWSRGDHLLPGSCGLHGGGDMDTGNRGGPSSGVSPQKTLWPSVTASSSGNLSLCWQCNGRPLPQST